MEIINSIFLYIYCLITKLGNHPFISGLSNFGGAISVVGCGLGILGIRIAWKKNNFKQKNRRWTQYKTLLNYFDELQNDSVHNPMQIKPNPNSLIHPTPTETINPNYQRDFFKNLTEFLKEIEREYQSDSNIVKYVHEIDRKAAALINTYHKVYGIQLSKNQSETESDEVFNTQIKLKSWFFNERSSGAKMKFEKYTKH